MDPITVAIVAALGKLGEQAIQDAYNALKFVLSKKFGVDGKLFRSVKYLEDDPDSKASKLMLEEQVQKTNALKDPEVIKSVQALRTLLEKSMEKPINSTIINQQAGSHSEQFGQVGGNVVINKKRLL